MPHEKQLSPPQAALDSAAPCRGAFQTAVSQKPPLQGEVDAPQGADGGVHCRFAAEVSCKTGQSLAPCFVRDDFRAKSRHFVLCAPKRRLRAAVLASSRKACGAASLKAAGEIARPTLRPGAGGGIQPAAPTRPAGGPMKSSAPTQGAALHNHHPPAMPAVPDSAARLPYIVGRAFTPAGKVRGGPEGYWQSQVPHPSVGFADSSPSRGAFQTAVSQKPPL